jgi:hypothetical protein
MNKIQQILIVHETLRRKWSLSFSVKGGLEDQITVNAEWYKITCLPEVIDQIRKNSRKRRIILHGNASAHTVHRTIVYLSQKKVESMSHCAYSPCLLPNDFFPFIKKTWFLD